MLKKPRLPEPLVWLTGLILAGILAFPLALAESGLTVGSLLLAPRLAPPAAQLPVSEMKIPPGKAGPLLKALAWSVVQKGPPTPEAEEAAVLSPNPGLLDDLRSRVRPQVAFSSAADEFEDMIEAAALKHQISPLLIKAVIQAESKFDPTAVSHKGAMGLMQVMPATGRAEGVHNLMDPGMNLEAGVRHLKKLLHFFDDDEQLALAAYNCGQEAMKRFNNTIPPFPETRSFVNRVMRYYSQHLKS
jgi:hypothetical protein